MYTHTHAHACVLDSPHFLRCAACSLLCPALCVQQNLEAARRAAEDAALTAENRHAKAVADGQATTQAAVAAGEAAVAATTTRLNEQRKRELEAAAKRKADELAAAQRQHEAAQRRLSQEHAQALAQREAELRDERRAGEEALAAQHGAAMAQQAKAMSDERAAAEALLNQRHDKVTGELSTKLRVTMQNLTSARERGDQLQDQLNQTSQELQDTQAHVQRLIEENK